jgi:hypothetical protein
MWRTGFFEQLFATMPISDYASAFFFAHPKRVTLRCSQTLLRRSSCNLKSTAGQRFASTSPSAVAKSPGPSFRGESVKRRRAQEFCRPQSSDHGVCKNKKPGKAGLFDELHFRSVHFTSLAI